MTSRGAAESGAASGHATAAPSTSAMNSRRVMSDLGASSPVPEQSPATANSWGHATCTLGLPREAALWIAIEHRLIEGIHIGGAMHEPNGGYRRGEVK
jgi:hypothetical protein